MGFTARARRAAAAIAALAAAVAAPIIVGGGAAAAVTLPEPTWTITVVRQPFDCWRRPTLVQTATGRTLFEDNKWPTLVASCDPKGAHLIDTLTFTVDAGDLPATIRWAYDPGTMTGGVTHQLDADGTLAPPYEQATIGGELKPPSFVATVTPIAATATTVAPATTGGPPVEQPPLPETTTTAPAVTTMRPADTPISIVEVDAASVERAAVITAGPLLELPVTGPLAVALTIVVGLTLLVGGALFLVLAVVAAVRLADRRNPPTPPTTDNSKDPA